MSNKMTDKEVVDLCRERYNKSIHFDTKFLRKNEKLQDQVDGKPYGDEVKGRSTAISKDMSDVVRSYMTSLVRTLLSDDNSFKFKPKSNSIEHIKEAAEKSVFVNEVINGQEDPDTLMEGWFETGLQQSASMLKAFVEEVNKTSEETAVNVTDTSVGAIEALFMNEDPSVTSVTILEKTLEESTLTNEELELIKNDVDEWKKENLDPSDPEAKPTTDEEALEYSKDYLAAGKMKLSEPTYEVEVRLERVSKKISIIQVPLSDFIAPADAKSRTEADIIGDIMYETRGTLKARGYSDALVDSLPSAEKDNVVREGIEQKVSNNDSTYNTVTEQTDVNDSQLVELLDLYVLMDYDKDGVIERRHVVISGNVLVNKPELFDNVPYPMINSIPRPMSIFGSSVAESIQDVQRMQTLNLRSIQNNMAAISNPSFMANENVRMEDFALKNFDRVIRVDGQNAPAQSLQQHIVEYTADRTQMLMQFMENRKSSTTGALISSQGLSADTLNEETASKFNGMKDHGDAKVELVTMRIAKGGMRNLAETIVYLAKEYFDKAVDFEIDGEMVSIDPSKWTTNTRCEVTFTNKDKDLDKYQAINGLLIGLKQIDPILVDSKKLYNSASKILTSSGESDIESFINDPEVPEQTLMAENEQMKLQIQQLQGFAESNQLAEAAKIEAEGELLEQQHKKQVDIAKLELDNKKADQDHAIKMAELELKQQSMALEILKVENEMGRDANADIQDNMNIK